MKCLHLVEEEAQLGDEGLLCWRSLRCANTENTYIINLESDRPVELSVGTFWEVSEMFLLCEMESSGGSYTSSAERVVTEVF